MEVYVQDDTVDILDLVNTTLPALLRLESEQDVARLLELLKINPDRVSTKFLFLYKGGYLETMARTKDQRVREAVYRVILSLPLKSFYKDSPLSFKSLYKIAKSNQSGKHILCSEFSIIKKIFLKMVEFICQNPREVVYSKEMVVHIFKYIELEELDRRKGCAMAEIMKIVTSDLFRVLELRSAAIIPSIKQSYLGFLPHAIKYLGEGKDQDWTVKLKQYFGYSGLHSTFKLFYKWIGDREKKKKSINVINAINLIYVLGLDFVGIERDLMHIFGLLVDSIKYCQTNNNNLFDLLGVISKLGSHFPDRLKPVIRENTKEIGDSIVKFFRPLERARHRKEKSSWLVDLFMWLDPEFIQANLEGIFSSNLPNSIVNEFAYTLFIEEDRYKESAVLASVMHMVKSKLSTMDSNLDSSPFLEFYLHFHPCDLSRTAVQRLLKSNYLVAILALYHKVSLEPEKHSHIASPSDFQVSFDKIFKSQDLSPKYLARYIKETSQIEQLLNYALVHLNISIINYFTERFPVESQQYLFNTLERHRFPTKILPILPKLQRLINIDPIIRSMIFKQICYPDFFHDNYTSSLFFNHVEFPEIYFEFASKIQVIDYNFYLLHLGLIRLMRSHSYPEEEIDRTTLVFLRTLLKNNVIHTIEYLIDFVKQIKLEGSVDRDTTDLIQQQLFKTFAHLKNPIQFLKNHERFANHFILSVLFDPNRNGGTTVKLACPESLHIQSTPFQVQNLIYQHILSYVLNSFGSFKAFSLFVFKYAMVSKLFFSIISKLISNNRYLYLQPSERIYRIFTDWSLFRNGFYHQTYSSLYKYHQADINGLFCSLKSLTLDVDMSYMVDGHLETLQTLRFDITRVRRSSQQIANLISRSPNLTTLKIIIAQDTSLESEETAFISGLAAYQHLQSVVLKLTVTQSSRSIRSIHETLVLLLSTRNSCPTSTHLDCRIRCKTASTISLDLLNEINGCADTLKIEESHLPNLGEILQGQNTNVFRVRELRLYSPTTEFLQNVLNTSQTPILTFDTRRLKDIDELNFKFFSERIRRLKIILQDNLISEINLLESLSKHNSTIETVQFIDKRGNQSIFPMFPSYNFNFYQCSKYLFCRTETEE